MKRIVVLCGGPFAFPVLYRLGMERLLAGIAVATGDYKVVANLEQECEKQQLPFLAITERNDQHQLADWLNTVQPDYVFSVCYPFKISAEITGQFRNRIFNFHPGSLPEFRGPAPIFEVLRQGAETTALTVHSVSEEFDRGEIIFEEKIKINNDDNYVSLAQRLSARCGIMALNVAEMLQFGSVEQYFKKQNEERATFYKFPKAEVMTVNWSEMSSREVYNLIRACSGWTPGAITYLGDEKIHLSQAEIGVKVDRNIKPGTITAFDENAGIEVVCADGITIHSKELKSELGNPGWAYWTGAGLKSGSVLGKELIEV